MAAQQGAEAVAAPAAQKVKVGPAAAARAAWAGVRRHPALVPLLFCAANLRHPAKLRAHNAAVCLLVAVAAECISDMGGAAWAWGAVAPPAAVGFLLIPLYLLLMRWCCAPSAASPPSPGPGGWSRPAR